MSKVTNLRRYKKSKARDEKRAQTKATPPKSALDLVRARKALDQVKHDGHKRDD